MSGAPSRYRWGMVIDLDWCTACRGCVVACQAENNLPPGDRSEAQRGRANTWMRITSRVEGEYPHVKVTLLPMPCQQCSEPPCVTVCPVRATYVSDEGIVGQIYERCIGCRYCTAACPYTARYFNWSEPEYPEPISQGHNPDVSVRAKGVVEKCTFCHHRLQHARERAKLEKRELGPGDYVPACVEACPADAMVFGNLADSESEVSRLARSRRAFRLLEELGTEPGVIYLHEKEQR